MTGPARWTLSVGNEAFARSLPLTNDPERLSILNRNTIDAALQVATVSCNAFGAALPHRCPPPAIPPVRLRVVDRALACNLLDIGFRFVSAVLRAALQAAPADVAYLDVDTSACPPEIQALDYKLLYVALYANPIDMVKTEGRIIEAELPNGTVTQRWVPAPLTRRKSDGRIYWRGDFAWPGPIFEVPGQRWTMVSDEVAERVLRAGIADVQFVDFFAGSEQKRLVIKCL